VRRGTVAAATSIVVWVGEVFVVSSALKSRSDWGLDKIDLAQATEFAKRVTPIATEQAEVARNLAAFPPQIRVRGLFFEGLARIVGQMHGPGAMADLAERAGLPGKTTAFRAYPHRDFYRLYYLAARSLYPTTPLADSVRLVARTFFPIFQDSLLGRTMTALMGDQPATILPLLARAYNLSVEGNLHSADLRGARELVWSCEVEPVEWYSATFTGIIEGAMPPGATARVLVEERTKAPGGMRYRFRIHW
jgi:uncharacterized protein (TIGR02265 family)